MKAGRKFYPVIYCQHENTAIGVSNIPLRWKWTGSSAVPIDVVNFLHWLPGNCKWKPGYEINMTACEAGDVVWCPKCNHPVDFRAFGPVSSVPVLR
jgi:hypothetical protein